MATSVVVLATALGVVCCDGDETFVVVEPKRLVAFCVDNEVTSPNKLPLTVDVDENRACEVAGLPNRDVCCCCCCCCGVVWNGWGVVWEEDEKREVGEEGGTAPNRDGVPLAIFVDS